MIVASYNVHKCKGVDGLFRPDRIADVIAELGADVVAIQEADRRFGRRIGLLDVMHLRQKSGLVLVPASRHEDGHGWHGNALLVREGTKVQLRCLQLPGLEPRGAIVAELSGREGRLRIVAAHLALIARDRMLQARTLLRVVEEGETMPTLLLGDFNEWRSGRFGRSALNVLAPVFGRPAPAPSFPSRLPMLSLDRILGWPAGMVTSVTAHDSPLARIASDHLPIRAEIRLGAQVAQAA